MSFEETLAAALDARLTPLVAQVERLTAEVVQLRRALPPQLVSPEEAAKVLGLSLSSVRRRIKDGSLPVRRVGRAVRVDVEALRPLTNEEVGQLARDARYPRPLASRGLGLHARRLSDPVAAMKEQS